SARGRRQRPSLYARGLPERRCHAEGQCDLRRVGERWNRGSRVNLVLRSAADWRLVARNVAVAQRRRWLAAAAAADGEPDGLHLDDGRGHSGELYRNG